MRYCFRWLDQKNYVELTRPWYAKALPLPYSYYYPGRYERDANRHLKALYDQDVNPQALECHVRMQIFQFKFSLFVGL